MALQVVKVVLSRDLFGCAPQTAVGGAIKGEHRRLGGGIIPVTIALSIEPVGSCGRLTATHPTMMTHVAKASEMPSSDLICDEDRFCINPTSSLVLLGAIGCVTSLTRIGDRSSDLAGESINTIMLVPYFL